MLECRYLIVGAGETGLRIAKELQATGQKVILVEQGKLGGNYLHTYDVPRRQLRQVAKDFGRSLDVFKHHQNTFSVLQKHRQEISRRLQLEINARSQKLEKDLKEIPNLQILYGVAEFVSKTLMEVNSDTERHLVTFENCIITTGKSQLIQPDIPGLAGIPFLYQYNAYLLEEVPTRLAIVGCSVSTLEIADIYASLGVKVDVYEQKSVQNCLPKVDRTGLNYLLKHLVTKQVDFHFNYPVKRVTNKKGQLVLESDKDKSAPASHLYLQVRESFAADTLSLSKIGLESTDQGIRTDRQGRSPHKHILALGEASDQTRVGNKQAMILEYIQQQTTTKPVQTPRYQLPFVSAPENVYPRFSTVATILGIQTAVCVGYSETEAVARFGPQAKSKLIHFGKQDFVKIVYKESNLGILGLCLAGNKPVELQSLAIMVVEKNWNLHEFRQFLRVYYHI